MIDTLTKALRSKLLKSNKMKSDWKYHNLFHMLKGKKWKIGCVSKWFQCCLKYVFAEMWWRLRIFQESLAKNGLLLSTPMIFLKNLQPKMLEEVVGEYLGRESLRRRQRNFNQKMLEKVFGSGSKMKWKSQEIKKKSTPMKFNASHIGYIDRQLGSFFLRSFKRSLMVVSYFPKENGKCS